MDPGSPLGVLLDYLLWLATEPGPAWRERAEEVVGLVVGLVVDGPLPCSRPPVEPPPLAAALDHVRRVWAGGRRPVALAELAGAASVTPAHLSRVFARHVGLGPVAALGRVRLAGAEPLLRRSDLTVTRIARSAGFVDPLHFSRRFRAVAGVSPRTYRDAHPPPPSVLTIPALRTLARRLSG